MIYHFCFHCGSSLRHCGCFQPVPASIEPVEVSRG